MNRKINIGIVPYTIVQSFRRKEKAQEAMKFFEAFDLHCRIIKTPLQKNYSLWIAEQYLVKQEIKYAKLNKKLSELHTKYEIKRNKLNLEISTIRAIFHNFYVHNTYQL